MIIIIEGPDGSGKTTLAGQLARQNNYEIVHRAQPKTEEDKKEMLESYLTICKTRKNIILDRCWYSELAYGPVMRDASVITYPQMYDLERLVAKSGGMVIYCTGNRNTMWHRAHTRGEQYIEELQNFNEICENYDGMFAMPHLIPVVRYECPTI